jgi:hypothetical protein
MTCERGNLPHDNNAGFFVFEAIGQGGFGYVFKLKHKKEERLTH